MERDAFLARVAVAVGEASLPEAPAYVGGPLLYETTPDDLVRRFVANLEAVDGHCLTVDSDEGAVHAVVDLMAKHNATTYLSWDQSVVAVTGLLDALDRAGHRRLATDVAGERPIRSTRHAEYGPVRVGITGAVGGLAETGSLVLSAGPGRSRMASLVAPVHIALLRAPDIAPSLSHWVGAHPTALRESANLVVVTGPSRTADIEQQLNLGVHGPGTLEVIVLPG